MDETEAVDALWQARQEDMETRNPSPRAPVPEPVEATPNATEPVVEGAPAEEADSFTGYGPDDLPSELRPYYDRMLADYTRKTQEIAAERKRFDEIGGFETAQEAVEFATQLQTDPDYAFEVYQGLSTALEQAGYTPEEASNEAVRQVQQAAEPQWDETEGEWDEGSDITPLQGQIEALTQWAEQLEEERDMERHAFDLQRQEAVILKSNPNYEEQDIEDIYALAWQTGGDLLEAEERFRSMRDRFVGSYASEKASVPTGITPPQASAPAQVPEAIPTLDEAHEAAVLRLMAAIEEGNN